MPPTAGLMNSNRLNEAPMAIRYKCRACGYGWQPRRLRPGVAYRPKECPECKSRMWARCPECGGDLPVDGAGACPCKAGEVL